MDITLDAQELKRALRIPKDAVAKKGSTPTLRGLRLEAEHGNVSIEGTNTAVLATTQLPAEVADGGSLVIDAAQLDRLLKSKGDVRIFTEDDKVNVVNGIAAKVPSLPEEEWPKRDTDFSSAPSFPISVELLEEILPATSPDEARPILTCVYFFDREAVGTDSYRLHVRRGIETPTIPLLISRDVLLQVVKAGHDARVFVKDDRIGGEAKFDHLNIRLKVEAGPNSWYLWPNDGEYPNYRNLIPHSFPDRIVVDRDALIDVVGKVRVLVSPADVAPVRLELTKDGLTARTVSYETDVAASIPCEWSGEDCTLAFTAKYLIECVKVCPESTLVIGVPAPGDDGKRIKPVGFKESRPDGTESLRLLMPVRVDH